jgi:hypothetical protein
MARTQSISFAQKDLSDVQEGKDILEVALRTIGKTLIDPDECIQVDNKCHKQASY